jgi:hypothetical protein
VSEYLGYSISPLTIDRFASRFFIDGSISPARICTDTTAHVCSLGLEYSPINVLCLTRTSPTAFGISCTTMWTTQIWTCVPYFTRATPEQSSSDLFIGPSMSAIQTLTSTSNSTSFLWRRQSSYFSAAPTVPRQLVITTKNTLWPLRRP